MHKRISLKDIANHVGVSTTLVSYVLNNKERKGRVGVDMANRIRRAAAELDYKPNLIAKSLKSGKTNTIGLIVADISNPFFFEHSENYRRRSKKTWIYSHFWQ